MNTVGSVWACPTIGHTQFIAVRIGKMKVFCPKNWESTLANNSTGDNEVSSLEFGGTVFSQKPNWTYINCVSWCILHFRPILAPFQIPILPPTCQVMIVDVQSYICCWMSYSAYSLHCLKVGYPNSRGLIPLIFPNKQTTMNGPFINVYHMLHMFAISMILITI